MADISKIKTPDNTEYSLKDTEAREMLETKMPIYTIGTPTVLVNTTTVSFSKDGDNSWYISGENPISLSISSSDIENSIFFIEWDNVEYKLFMKMIQDTGPVRGVTSSGYFDWWAIGNISTIGFGSTLADIEAPFAVTVDYMKNAGERYIISYDTAASHTIKISKASFTKTVCDPAYYADTRKTGYPPIRFTSNNGSVAESGASKSSGAYSHAEGVSTVASGDNSHAEGFGTTASGNSSHAEGYSTTASGTGSSATGRSTIANHKSQHVFGEYNVADTNAAAATDRGTYVEIVGNGTASNAKSNARTLDWNGNEVLAGTIEAIDFGTALQGKVDERVDDRIDANVAILEATPGKVCSFSDAAEGVQLNDLQVSIEPKQASGTPWIDSTVLHKTPYLFTDVHSTASRIGNHIYDKLVGGTVAFNQLVNDPTNMPNTTKAISQGSQITSGHKYLFIYNCKVIDASISTRVFLYAKVNGESVISGLSLITLNNGDTACIWSSTINTIADGLVNSNNGVWIFVSSFTNLTFNSFNVIDLTQMFGSTIADYIYSLEQSTAGAGVAWFRKYFPKAYYAYNAGGLMSVKTSAHVTTGFNQWDEEWDSGYINATTGQNDDSVQRLRSKNYIPCIPNATYYYTNLSATSTNTLYAMVYFYDANKNYIGRTPNGVYPNKSRSSPDYNNPFTTPTNAHYMRFWINISNPTTYNHDICINLSLDGEQNGEYEPYVKHEYPLDGQRLVHRKFNIVDLGTLDWVYRDNNIFTLANNSRLSDLLRLGGMICPRFVTNNVAYTVMLDKQISNYGSFANKDIQIKDTAYSDADVFKTAMSGVYLTYEVATPFDETVTNPELRGIPMLDSSGNLYYYGDTCEDFEHLQIVDPYGTEEYVDNRTIPIPVGHETYQANISDIIGYDTVNIHNTNSNVAPLFSADSSFNGVVNFNQLVQNGNFVDTTGWAGQQASLSVNNGIATITRTNNYPRLSRSTSYLPSIISGHKYLFLADIKKNQAVNGYAFTLLGSPNKAFAFTSEVDTWKTYGFVYSATGSLLNMYIADGQQNATEGYTAQIKNVNVIDLTQMFGSTIADYIYSLEQGTAGAGVAFFRSIYPNDYYAYDTGTDEMVGSREGNTYTIQLGDTYYGCVLDVTNGVLTIDKACVTLDSTKIWFKNTPIATSNAFISSPNNQFPDYKREDGLCSHFATASGSSASSGVFFGGSINILTPLDLELDTVEKFKQWITDNTVQVLYTLATPITVQLTPTQIEQLLGANNVWADTGDVEELKYYTDSQTIQTINALSKQNNTDTIYTGTGVISVDSSTHVISSTAEVNQNAFSNIKVGNTSVAADAKMDTLELVSGDNITLTPDSTNDKITIASANNKVTQVQTEFRDADFPILFSYADVENVEDITNNVRKSSYFYYTPDSDTLSVGYINVSSIVASANITAEAALKGFQVTGGTFTVKDGNNNAIDIVYAEGTDLVLSDEMIEAVETSVHRLVWTNSDPHNTTATYSGTTTSITSDYLYLYSRIRIDFFPVPTMYAAIPFYVDIPTTLNSSQNAIAFLNYAAKNGGRQFAITKLSDTSLEIGWSDGVKYDIYGTNTPTTSEGWGIPYKIYLCN